jgi:hypothetical protein
MLFAILFQTLISNGILASTWTVFTVLPTTTSLPLWNPPCHSFHNKSNNFYCQKQLNVSCLQNEEKKNRNLLVRPVNLKASLKHVSNFILFILVKSNKIQYFSHLYVLIKVYTIIQLLFRLCSCYVVKRLQNFNDNFADLKSNFTIISDRNQWKAFTTSHKVAWNWKPDEICDIIFMFHTAGD